MRLCLLAVVLTVSCAGGLSDQGSAFWDPALGEPVPNHVELRPALTLPHLDRWRCADVNATGEVHGVRFDQLRYCALDGVLAMVTVTVEGASAEQSALVKFCDSVGVAAEVSHGGDIDLASCAIEVNGESISADFAEGEGLSRTLSLYREDMEVREQFYRYSISNMPRRAEAK